LVRRMSKDGPKHAENDDDEPSIPVIGYLVEFAEISTTTTTIP